MNGSHTLKVDSDNASKMLIMNKCNSNTNINFFTCTICDMFNYMVDEFKSTTLDKMKAELSEKGYTNTLKRDSNFYAQISIGVKQEGFKLGYDGDKNVYYKIIWLHK